MILRRFSLFALLLFVSQLQAETLTPLDFAFGMPIIPAKEAAAYRLSLSLPVYQNSRADLSDLRVFNAGGIAVPFTLSRPVAPSPARAHGTELPLFPLPQGSRIAIDGVRVTISSPGSAVNLQTQNGGTADSSISQYIIDGRGFDATVAALQLAWPDTAPEYSGRVRIEGSDDLATWRSIAAAAPIANLRANGQTLIENRAGVTPSKARFWRITWLGSPPAFALTSVSAEPADGPIDLPRDMLDLPGTNDSADPALVDFDLGAHLPVSQVNVLLPELNTVMDIVLSSRPTPKSPWQPVTRAGFYRLKTSDNEQHNAPLPVGVNTDRYWQAAVKGTDRSVQPRLTLHVEWVPNEVRFLAQGQRPFLLSYGAANALRAEADLSHLPNSLEVGAATLGPPRVLGGADRLIVKPPAFPRTRVALWAVLLLAVVLLVLMAHSLSKDAGGSPN
jgi:hypothetical protein